MPSRATHPASRPGRRVACGAALGLALAVSTPLAASAHIMLDASTAAPATLSVLTFAIEHGCEGSPTTSLAVRLPANVQSVRPTVAPGWSIAEAETADGTTVTYTADTPLPDSQRDTVQIEALLPVDGRAGDQVVFPTLQTCAQGSTAWDEVPTAGSEPDHPAPTLTLAAATTAAGAAPAASNTAAAVPPVDETARLLGFGGLVAGVVAVMLLTVALRRPQQGGRR